MPISLGYRMQTESSAEGAQSVQVANIGRYVDIKKTLKSLCRDGKYVRNLQKVLQSRQPGLYKYFQDGTRYQMCQLMHDTYSDAWP